MRAALVLILIFVTSLSYGKDRKLKGKPATLEEAFQRLDQIFNDTSAYAFKILPEDIAAGRLHMGLGMWMRNHWGLWGNGKLKRFFIEKGIEHPDDMSGIILRSYHRHLNNKPVDLEGQIRKNEEFYKSIVTKGDTIIYPVSDVIRTTDSVLMQFFPVADTIIVRIYAGYRKWFQNYATGVNAIAVVKEHRDSKLIVEIISIDNKKGWKTERHVGDVFDTYLIFCSPLPPPNWHRYSSL